MDRNNWPYSVVISFVICLFFSTVISFTIVKLKPLEEKNALEFKNKVLLKVAGYTDNEINSIPDIYSKYIVKFFYDFKSSSCYKIPKTGDLSLKSNLGFHELFLSTNIEKIPSKYAIKDIQGANKVLFYPSEYIPRYIPIYLVLNNSNKNNIKGYMYNSCNDIISNLSIDKVILPVVGQGLWSKVFGFISLGKKSNFRKVHSVKFYDHKETPGLGGEVDNALWLNKWVNKIIFSNNYDVKLQVIKGFVQSDDVNKNYKVDGLSGASITTRGLDRMVKYWGVLYKKVLNIL